MKKRNKQKNDRRFESAFLQTVTHSGGFPFSYQILVFLVTTLICVQATTDPTSFTCTAYNSTVIRLDWTAASDVNVAGYYLYLRRTDGLKTQEGPGITLPARNYISYTFYGLGYYAQYDISINSYNSGGSNNTVYTVSCTTLADNPDLSNFNLTCEGISYYEISCTWGSLDNVYWNGVPFGWRLGHISYYNDEYTYIDFNTTATLAYTIQGLQFDTKYLINIRSVNTGGFYGPFSSTNSKTLGWPTNTENATRYFCYEAIPGTLEFSWLEMPCTIYSGTIAGLLLISLLLLMLCCCMCCCKGGSKNNSNTEINIYNEENNEYYGDDGDDDDEEESDEEYSEEEEEEDEDMEEEDMSDDAESPTKGAVLAKKKKLSDDEKDSSEEEEEEESEDEESDEDSETDVEIYAGLTEEEKKKKKEERAAEKAKKKEEKAKRKAEKKKLKEEKSEESKKKKIEEQKRKEEERKEKIRERMKKRNAMMAGATTVKTVDETKKAKEAKEKKKKPVLSDEDEESEGYYEDWNPDADENPDVEVNKVSMKENKKSKDGKNSDGKAVDKKSSDKKKSDKRDDKKKKNKAKSKESNDDDDEEENDEYDDDDDYDDEDSEEEDYTSEDENQPKKKTKKSISKDSGRGSASSNLSNWGEDNTGSKSLEKSDKSKLDTQAEPKKKGGFLSKLFGTSKSKDDTSSNNNKQNNKTDKQNAKNTDYGDWGDNEDDLKPSNSASNKTNTANDTSSNTYHTANLGGTINNGYQSRNTVDHLGNPIIVNSNPHNNTGYQDSNQYNDRPPPGYGLNPNGTFHPLPGNYNKVPPPGFVRNSDGSIQRNNYGFQNSNNMDNGPPPGYAKNFDGTFYPVPGNNNPLIPPGFSRNPDGTIFRNPQQLQSNNYSSVAPPGYGKNPDGTFYPLPGNNNPIVPQGYAKNRDGSIFRTSNQGNSSYPVTYNTNDPPPGYGRNPDGTFYPKPGNRNPVVPPGFARNPDGTIYRTAATSSNNQNNFASDKAPPGYAKNSDGTFHPLPGNFNPVVPLGFSKNPNGSIYRSSREPFPENSDVAPPPGYMKSNDGSFRPLPNNRNPVVPPGFTKNSDGSIFHDPYQTSNSTSNDPPLGYRKNPDGNFYPLPNNRNPVVPAGYVKNPNGSIIRQGNQTNSQYGTQQYNRNAPPPGFAPNQDGSFRPLPGNKNPVVPFGFTKSIDGTIRENNNRQPDQEIPQGYAKNPDGTFRPLPGNTKPVVPAGYTKNPDGTIRRNRNNPINRNNEVPAGYGKNPYGTFYPLKGNSNPVVPEGYRKNPDGTISKLPNYQSKQALASNRNPYAGNAGQPKTYTNTSGTYPYGPKELDPPELSDDRDKFNALFVAKAKQKAIQKKDRAIVQGNYQPSASNNPTNFTGDGEDIFAPQSGQNGSQNYPSSDLGDNGRTGRHGNTQPSNGNIQRPALNHGSIPTGQKASDPGTAGMPTNSFPGKGRDIPLNNSDTSVSFPTGDYNNGINGAVGYQNGSGHDNPVGNPNDTSNVHAGRKPGQPPFSFGSGKNPDIVISNRKPISFREDDPKYHDFSQRRKSKQQHPHDTGDERQNAQSDASDTEVLPDDRPSSRKKPPLRFRNSNQPPAWDSKHTDNDKSDKSGKKTPVTELKPRQELIEPEPVIGTDRLGNKFPFLNINQRKESKPADKSDKNTQKDDNPGNKRKSDNGVVLRGRELVDKKDIPKRDFPPLPNTLTGEAGAIAASNDLGGLKQETRDEIFYGFGVGRWRMAAAKWLNKWKMKKKPVKTAKSSWD